ncbi:AAA family ATPase [Alkalinema sp. FACHB-956]|uniref:AAA family ATPase n=1 Tax=Alkalinema sp. FACHB-956 TaxID=2692768 RepID=UPI001681C631|nr:AAA family ATPase [Alkalinema sp. FACHB-956]MBD2325706.1 AAA family ATPase [Alkalinema sp. FACHB-956]
MITSIELENVRIFEGTGWNFSLLPMTVFCGTNSAGKSTILKALLLLQQSQAVRESYGGLEGRLRLVGNQVDLGSYSSFVSNNETRRSISLSVTITDKMPTLYYQRILALKPENKNTEEGGSISSDHFNGDKRENQFVDYVLKSSFTFGIVRGKRKKSSETSTLKVIEGSEGTVSFTPQALLKEAKYEISVNNEKLLCWSVKRSDDEDDELSYEILLPKNFFNSIGAADAIVPKSKTKMYVKLSVSHPGIIPSSIIAKVQDSTKNPSKIGSELSEKSQWLVARLPPVIREAMIDLNNALNEIHYVGPLRSSPQRYYLSYSESVPRIDPTGEALPYILREKAVYNSSVYNIPPCTNGEPIQEPLSKALNSWLYYLRTGKEPTQDIKNSEIEVRTTSDLVVELRIRSTANQKCYSLADSGFGYSQVLPIVVKGLLAEQGSMLLIEQPELHLNPALQVRLSDFFIAMVRSKKHILLETHSEHIVNAIRVLTAEDESGDLATSCGIYFIDADSDRPLIHKLSVQSDGTVPDLPHNFFGEAISLSGRLLRAQKRFRKSVQG